MNDAAKIEHLRDVLGLIESTIAFNDNANGEPYRRIANQARDQAIAQRWAIKLAEQAGASMEAAEV